VGAGDLRGSQSYHRATERKRAGSDVIELGDGILGGYSVESIFEDAEFREAMTALIFCASDYVRRVGGIELFRRRGIEVDLVGVQ